MLLPVRWNLIGGPNPERERLSTHVDDNQQQEQRVETFRPSLFVLVLLPICNWNAFSS